MRPLRALRHLAAALAAFAGAALAQVCPTPPTATTYVPPINTYYTGTGASVPAGSSSVPIGAVDTRGALIPIAAGDVLLVIQMQGADIDPSNTNRYGDGQGDGGTGYTTTGDYAGGVLGNGNYRAGQFEYAVASGPASGGAVPIFGSLANTYTTQAQTSTAGRRVYQVLRVPQYASVAITTTIRAIPWNGTNGGVIAMDVAGNMNFIGGTIDASGRGFRGGGAFGGNAFTNAFYNYVATTNASAPGGGVKGEGIAGTPARTFSSLLNTISVDSGVQGYPGGDYARGAPGNAGGGSNQHNGGGGGGGNGARGGNGGRTWNQNQNNYSGEDVGGFGGEAVTGVRAAMGGGGGSADINNQCAGTGCATANGGPGGGIVFIRAGSITGSGAIIVRGADAPDGLLNATDGAGGGGAGGTVVIQANTGGIPGGLTIDLRGGRGGNSSMGGVNETDGPGGGGAGGRLLSTVSGGNVLTAGGVPGVIFNTTNPALGTSDGASPGGSGSVTTVAPGSIPGGSGPAQCLPTLTVTKSTQAPTILPGTDRFTYSITVTNTGTGTARLVQIQDNLVPPWQLRTDPVVFTQTNATRPSVQTPAGGSTNLTFGAFDIAGTSPGPAGSVTATFVVDLQGAAPGKYDNSASVTFLDPTTGVPGTRVTPGGTYATGGTVAGANYNGSLAGSTTDDVTILAGPTVTKAFAPATIVTGGTATLTITLANPNPTLPMTAVALIDDLPQGITVAATPAFTQTPANCAGTVVSGATAGDRRIQTSAATLAAAASCQISVAVTSNTASRLRNFIPPGNVTGVVSGNSLGNAATAADFLTVIAPPFISKAFTPNAIAVGAQSTLAISVTNPPGNIADLTGVAFTDNFPSGISNASPGSIAPSGAGCAGNATSVNGATPGVSLAGATVPVGTTCTWSTIVTKASASPAGGDQNETGAVSATGPVASTGNTARDTLTVAGGILPPTLGKSFGSSLLAVGGTATLSLVVTNPNASALTVLQLTDALPAGLQVAAAPGLVNACGLTVGGATAGSTTVSLTGGTIPAGGACTVTLNLTATTAGDFVNTTSSLTTLQAPASNIATARLTAVAAPVAAKSFTPTTITAGGISVMRIRIFNPASNTVPLAGVAFTDAFPAGLRVASTPALSNGCGGSVSPGGTANDASLALSGGTIGYQAFCDITVNVTAVAAGTYNNATGPIATSAGATGASASASLSVFANTLPPISNKSFSPTRITAGGVSRLTLALGNPNGSVTLTGVGVVDTFPAGLSIVAPLGAVSGVVSADNPCGATFTGGTVGATSVTITGITLTPLDTCALSWNVTSSTLGNSNNTTGPATATGPFAQSGNVAGASLTVLSLAPPNTTKDFNPRQIASGGLTRLTISLVNANPSDDLTGIAFSDAFPAGMTIANPPNLSNPCAFTISPAVAAGNASIVVTGGTLPAGGSCQLGVDVTYTGATGNVTNTTSAVTSALTTPGNTAAGVLSIVGAQPPQITKSFNPAQIPAGGTSTMTVTVTNPNATFALTGVSFADAYPAGLTNATPGSVAPTGAGCASAATSVNGGTPGLSLAGATIPAAGGCTWSVAVTKATAGNVVNTTGAVTATGPAALTGNSASTALGVGTLLAPQVNKFFSPDVLPLGSVSALTLVFTNANAGTSLNGITLTDTFPAGLTVAAAPGVASGVVSATNTCGLAFTGGTAGAGNITVTGGQVPAGGTCNLVVNVTTTTAGSVTNTTGSVASTNGGTGNTASARLNVVNYLPPQLAMTIAPGQVAVNGTATMTFTVANPNPNTALTGIAFSTGAFPGGWVVANPTGLVNACGLTVQNNTGGALAAGSLGIQVTAGTVPAAGSCTVSVNITDPSAATSTETTNAVTATGPVALTGNTASATLVTNNAAATLPPQIAKSFLPAQIPRGGLSVLTFTIANPNAVALTGINFTDTFPAGMVVANVPGVASGTPSASNPCGLAFTGGAAGGANLNVTTGTVPANASCVLQVNVTTTSTATLTNTTGAVGATGPATVTGNTAQGVLVSNNPLAPVVKKAFVPAQVVSGGTSRLQVEISNPNPQQNLTGIALTDAFPANIQVAATPNFATDPAGACTGINVSSGNAAGNTALNFTALTVNAGAGSCRISVDVVRNPGGTGVHTNTTGTVTATGPVALTGNSDSATLTFVAAGTLQPPQLAQQISPAQINVGGIARLRLTITNPNPNSLAGVAFTDTFPAGMVVAAAPNLVNSCALNLTGGGAGANNVNVTASTLNPSTVCFVEVDVTTTATGNFINTTSVIQSTTAGNGNSTSAILSAASVAPPVIAKAFSPASAQPGDVVQMTFTVTNPNLTASLTGLAFTDAFPAGLVVAPTPGVTSGAVSATNSCGVVFTGGTAGAGTLNVTNGIVPAGGVCILTVNVTKATSGSVTNTTGSVSATGPAAVTGNAATASLDIATRPPQITKGISPRVMVQGGTSTLTITLFNPNSATALNQVAFVDNFPAGLSIAAGTNAASGVTSAQNTCGLAFTGGTVGGTSVSITAVQNQSLAAGVTCTLRWTVTSNTLGLAVNTTGAVSSSNGGTGNVGSQAYEVTTAFLPLLLSKTFQPTAISPNGISALTLAVRNDNRIGALTGVAFTDSFPIGLTLATPAGAVSGVTSPLNTCGHTFTTTASSVTVTGGSVADSSTCTLVFYVTSALTTLTTLTNTTSSVTSTRAGVPAGDPASAVIVVGGNVLPQVLTKQISPAVISAGGTAQLRITIRNPNPTNPISALAITDAFPANVSVAAVPSFSNTCGGTVTAGNAAGNTSIALTGGVLTAGATCTIETNLTGVVPGTYNNTVTSNASSAGSGTNPSASLTIVAPTLAKAFTGGGAAIDPGATTTLTFTLTNGAGNPLATGIAFTDTLPAALTIAATPNVTTTCPTGASPGAPGFTVTAPAGGNAIAVTGAALNATVASCTISVDVTSSTVNPSCAANPATHTNGAANVTGIANVANGVTNTCLVVRPQPTLTKAFGAATIGLNDATTLAFTLDNTAAGAVNRTGLAFTDALPAGLSVANPPVATTSAGCAAVTLAGTANGSTSIGASAVGVNAGQLCVITFTVTGTTLGAKTNDAASITAITGMNNGVTPQVLTVLARPTVAKAFGAATIPTGGTTTLTITLANANAAAITGVAFTDTFPVAPGPLTLADSTSANTCGGTLANSGGGALAAGDAGIRLTGGTIPAGGSCAITVNVTASVAGSYTNTLAAGAVTSSNAGANATPATSTLAVLARPTVAKVFGAATIPVGGTTTLAVTVTNANAVALTGLAFTDVFPAVPGAMTLANTLTTNTCAGTLTDSGGGALNAGDGGIQLSGGTVPANASCTVTVNVTASTAGAYTNAIAAGGVTTTNGGSSAALASANLTVLGAPTVAKAFSPATIFPGASSVLTVTLTNANATAITGVAFTDAYPGGLVNAGTPALANTCGGTPTGAAGGTSLALSGGTIPANGSCTVSVSVTSAAAGVYTNSTGAVATGNAGTGTAASAQLTVVGAVTGSKSFSPATIATGGASTLTIAITNPNTTTAITGLAFTDTYPAGLANAAVPALASTCGGTASATAGGTSLTLTGGTLAASASCTITVQVTSATPGTLVNSTGAITAANAPSSAGFTGNLVVLARPTVAKAFGAATIPPGGSTTLTVTVTNANAVPLAGLDFTDTFPVAPGAMTLFDAGATNTCGGTLTDAASGALGAGDAGIRLTGGTVPANASCAVTVNVTATTPGAYTNTLAAGDVTTTNGGASTAPASASLTVLAPPTAAKAFSPSLTGIGQAVTLTVTLTNANATALTGAAFTDTYPAGLANAATPAISSSCGGTASGPASGNTLSLTGGTIPANGSCAVSVTVVPSASGSLVNSTGPIATANAGTGTAASATLTVLAAPVVTKAFSPVSVGQGQVSTLTITLANPNAQAITGAAFTDTYPGGLLNTATPTLSNSCGGTASGPASGGTLSLTGGTIPANGSCAVSVTVSAAAAGSYANSTGAVATANAGTGASANATLTVLAPLVTTKSFTPSQLGTGAPATLTLQFTNPNAAPVTGLAFTDGYPSGLVNAATPNATSSCGGTVTATAGGTSLALSGATVAANGTCSVTVAVTSAVAATYANTLAAGAITTTNAGSNAAPVTGTVSFLNAATVAKSFAPAILGAGGTSTLTITLTNPNASLALSGVAFTDTYPAGLLNTAVPTVSNSCGGTASGPGGGGTLSLSGGTVAAGGNCTVSVTVVAAAAGSYVNSTGPVTATNANAGASASATLTVLAPPTLAKAFSPTVVGPDQPSTLTLTLTNANTTAVTGVAFTDTYPSGLVNAATPALANSCGGTATAAAGGASLVLAGGTIPASGSCTVTVSVASATPGSYANASGPVTTANAGTGASAGATLLVLQRLTITKDFTPASVGANDTSLLTITFANPNATSVTGAAFTDTYPGGLVNAASPTATTTCPTGGVTATTGGASLAFTGGTVPANGTCTVTVGVTSATAGSYANSTGPVTTANAGTAVAGAGTLTVLEHPTVAKAFSPAEIPVNGTSTLTLTLGNPNGALAITGIAITDAFPTGLVNTTPAAIATTCGGTVAGVGGGTQVALAGGTIPAGGTCTITSTVTSASANTYTNTVPLGTLTSANAGASTAAVSATLTVLAPLAGAKAFTPASIGTGDTSVLTITFTNPNTSTAVTGIAFNDTYPAGVVNTGTPGGTSTCGGTLTAAAGGGGIALAGASVPAGGTCTITVNVTSAATGVYVNSTGPISTANAGTTAALTGSLTVLQHVTVAKAFAPNPVGANGASTLTITLTNANATPLAGVAFTDTYPAGLVNFAPAAGATTCATGTVTATNGAGSVSLAGGTVAANASCTITVNVTSATPGSYVNTLAAGAVTTTNAGASTVPASATLGVFNAPSIAKSFAPAAIAADGTSTVTFQLANTNPVPLTGGAFTDTLANMRINAAGAAGGTCAGAAGNVFAAGQTALAFTGLTVPAGGSCTVTVVVTSDSPGTHPNTTSGVTSNEAPLSAPSNTANLVVNAATPTIAKAFAPTSIAAAGISTVTLTIGNTNGTALTNAGFTDTLANMRVAANQNAGGTCAGAASNALTAGQTGITIAGLTIPANGSCTVTFTVTSNTAGTHPNATSGVSSTEAGTGAASNTATLTVSVNAATIAKAFAPASIAYGTGVSTITFTLGNANAIALTAGAFTDTLSGMAIAANQPVGGTCAGAAGNAALTAGQTALSFTGLTIPATGTCTVTVTVSSNAVGAHPNTASGVTTAEGGTGAVSNTATLTVTALAPTVAKSFTPNVIGNSEESTLVITITNPNDAPITVVTATDSFPVNLVRAVTPHGSTTCAGGVVSSTANSVTLSGGVVPANGSCSFQIDVQGVLPGAAVVNVIAAGDVVTNVGANTVPASATLTILPAADIRVTKTGPATVVSGGALSYTIVVSNFGPDAAPAATMSDTVPAVVTGVAASCGSPTGGAACGAVNVAGNAVTSTIPTLPSGGSVTFTVTGTAPATGTFTNSVVALPPAGTADPDDPGRTGAGTNGASVTTAVLTVDLQLTKTHPGGFTAGSNGTYTLLANNTLGVAPTSGAITVTDTLPAGLTFVSATGTDWSCLHATGVVTCTSSTVIPAGAVSANPITLVVAVGPTAVPNVTNNATVAGGNEPAVNNGNNAVADYTIVAPAGANTFQPDGNQSALPGSSVFYPHTFVAGLAGTVTFSTTSAQSPAVPGWTQVVYRDANCNGALDGAETAAPLVAGVAVSPGDSVCIVVVDNVPGAAPLNAVNVISVTATFTGPVATTRTDTTTVGLPGGAGLTLAKSVRNVTLGGAAGTANTARPNDFLEYTVTYTNGGSGALGSIVITDATPAFTTFQSATCTAPLPASLTACSATTQPGVGATGPIAWTLTGSLAPGSTGTVVFVVRVNP